MSQTVKNLPAIWETKVWSLGSEDPLEKGMATHCSILTWKIPWTEVPGGLQSMGSQRVRHDWATNTSTFHIYIYVCIYIYIFSKFVVTPCLKYRRNRYSLIHLFNNYFWSTHVLDLEELLGNIWEQNVDIVPALVRPALSQVLYFSMQEIALLAFSRKKRWLTSFYRGKGLFFGAPRCGWSPCCH